MAGRIWSDTLVAVEGQRVGTKVDFAYVFLAHHMHALRGKQALLGKETASRVARTRVLRSMEFRRAAQLSISG